MYYGAFTFFYQILHANDTATVDPLSWYFKVLSILV